VARPLHKRDRLAISSVGSGFCNGDGGSGPAGGGACAAAAQGCRFLGSRLVRVRHRSPRPRQVQAAPLALRQLCPRPRRDPAGA
jgi:hypothetical protein